MFIASYLVSLLLLLSLHFFCSLFPRRFYENNIFVNLTPKLLIKCIAYIYVIKFFSAYFNEKKCICERKKGKKRSSLFAFPEKNCRRECVNAVFKTNSECASYINAYQYAGTHLYSTCNRQKQPNKQPLLRLIIWIWMIGLSSSFSGERGNATTRREKKMSSFYLFIYLCEKMTEKKWPNAFGLLLHCFASKSRNRVVVAGWLGSPYCIVYYVCLNFFMEISIFIVVITFPMLHSFGLLRCGWKTRGASKR